MRRRNYWLLGIFTLILVLAVAAIAINPIFGRDGMKLGLDLKGGVNLEYQVPPGTTSAEVQKAVDVIETRIDRYGITQPIVQSVGSNRISVQLPGFTDINQAKNLVEQTGFLEFREVEMDSSGNPVTLKDYLDQKTLSFIDTAETGTRIFVSNTPSTGAKTPLPGYSVVAILQKNSDGTLGFVNADGKSISVDTLKQGSTSLESWIPARGTNKTQLTGSLLTDATAEMAGGATGTSPDVKLTWTDEGIQIFNQIAARLYARPAGSTQRELGIFLDQQLISAPEIQASNYTNGQIIIQGSFTAQQVTYLANLLNSGSLPVPLVKPPVYENRVSATLGANFTRDAVIAGIVAFILVILFMIVYYRIPGAMASIALIFYASVVLAVFKLWPVTLNLAGIGGFVLSLGMAVDANVIIFERMKEEIRGGRTLGAVIEAGFSRAWLAIRDSNITTIVACIILIWIGGIIPSGQSVRGFGITLLIGILVSMFTSLIVTRTLLNFFIGTKVGKNTSLFSAFTGRK